MNENPTILNVENLNDLDNFNILNQLDSRQGILLCSGNCNCINHLRQSISDPNSEFITSQIPESSSIATTSTIIDQNPIDNQNLIMETNLTNLTTFSNESNLSNESIKQDLNKEQSTNQPSDQGVNSLENRNSQLIRSSTFNDLNSYLKNYL